jgi:hypothetical protein
MDKHTHWGAGGIAVCGCARLLTHATTQDTNAVDCLDCLFTLQAQLVENINIIGGRLRACVKASLAVERVLA